MSDTERQVEDMDENMLVLERNRLLYRYECLMQKFARLRHEFGTTPAFPETVLRLLRDDVFVRENGYANDAFAQVESRILIVDGAPSKMMTAAAQESLLRGVWAGPWIPFIRTVIEDPKLLLAEVQLGGTLSTGNWHVDTDTFPLWVVVVPLNDMYDPTRGGSTEFELGAFRIQNNHHAVFCANIKHRRGPASTKSDATERRTVFMLFSDEYHPWRSIQGVRREHAHIMRIRPSRKRNRVTKLDL